jgi:hypothetical protein
MGLVFCTQFESGSLIEKVSGDLFTKVNNPVFKTSKKGLGLYTKGGYITKPNFSYNPTNKISFEITTNVHFVNLLSQIFIYTLNSYSTPYIIVYRSGAGDGKNLYVYYWTGSAQIAVSATNFFSTTGDYHIGITFDFSTGICIIYKNGILFGTYNPTTPQFPNLNYTLSLFGGTDQNQYTNYGVKYYDHILQSTEVTDRYNEFLNSKSIVKTKSKIIYPPVLAKTTDGLIAEYNFINAKKNIVVNEAPSSSANGNNAGQYNGLAKQGIIKGVKKLITSTNKDINWNGNYIDCGTSSLNLTNKLTVCCMFEMDVNKATFQPKNNHIGGISKWNSGGVSINSFFLGYNYSFAPYGPMFVISNGTSNFSTVVSGFNQYIYGKHTIIGVADGTFISLYFDGKFITRIAYTGNIYNSTYKLIINGFNNVTEYNAFFPAAFDYYNARIYNRAISEQEILDYHNQYATQPILLEDFSDYAVNTFPDKNWKKGGTTGIYVSQLTSDVTKFPELVKGTKIMYIYNAWCSFTKNVKIPRGSTIEWYWSGNNNSSSSQSIYLYDSLDKYYVLEIRNTRVLYIASVTPTITQLYLGTTVYTNNEWYKMKLILNTNNTLSLYIDDILIITTVASTVVSNINELRFGSAFLSVANIKITEGIVV